MSFPVMCVCSVISLAAWRSTQLHVSVTVNGILHLCLHTCIDILSSAGHLSKVMAEAGTHLVSAVHSATAADLLKQLLGCPPPDLFRHRCLLPLQANTFRSNITACNSDQLRRSESMSHPVS